jgi:hypothetical protein
VATTAPRYARAASGGRGWISRASAPACCPGAKDVTVRTVCLNHAITHHLPTDRGSESSSHSITGIDYSPVGFGQSSLKVRRHCQQSDSDATPTSRCLPGLDLPRSRAVHISGSQAQSSPRKELPGTRRLQGAHRADQRVPASLQSPPPRAGRGSLTQLAGRLERSTRVKRRKTPGQSQASIGQAAGTHAGSAAAYDLESHSLSPSKAGGPRSCAWRSRPGPRSERRRDHHGRAAITRSISVTPGARWSTPSPGTSPCSSASACGSSGRAE